MMNPVLCVTRKSFSEVIGMPPKIKGNNVYDFNMAEVDEKHFHFLSREVADSKNPDLFRIAQQLPQVLPYVLISCGDQILTYSRAKGAEDRLHGSLSCGFGGHVDIGDIDLKNFNLTPSIMRELEEELRLDLTKPFQFIENYILLLDNTNQVGQVHAGYVYAIELSSTDMVDPDPSEIHLPEWKTLPEMEAEKHRYENWSQSLIDELQEMHV